MKLYQYVIRRLILLVFVLFAVSALVFYFTRGFPRGIAPWTPYIHSKMTAEQIQEVIKIHGFDRPLYEQYFYWLRDILTGDWGLTGTWAQGKPANEVFFNHFPYTVELSVFGTLLTICIGIPLGIISAIKNNKIPDHISSITGLPLLDGLLSGNFAYAWDEFLHLILPSFSLAFISLGFLARIVRASMLEVLRQDYITMARSKGLKERVIIYRHALKNALIPAVTLTGIFFASLLGGAMITEYVFSWPGVGQQALRAIFQGDSNFILVYSLVFATIIVLANLVVDVLYAFLDPRIRY